MGQKKWVKCVVVKNQQENVCGGGCKKVMGSPESV